MNGKKMLLGFVLADFLALHVYALETSGITGFVQWAQSLAGWGLVLTVDLVIALSIIGVAMYRDARKKGMSPLPYLMMMPLAGSAGPLLYLLRSASKESAPS
jgi:hypothetical protein